MISLFKMCGSVSSLVYILRYVCYSVTDVTKCICWKTVYFLCNICRPYVPCKIQTLGSMCGGVGLEVKI